MQIEMVLEVGKDKLEMTVEGDIMVFLRIDFKHLPTGVVKMLQLGLTELLLKTTGMQDCNLDHTPSQTPLGKDKEGLSLQRNGVILQLFICCCIWQQIPRQKLPTPSTNVLNSPTTQKHLTEML